MFLYRDWEILDMTASLQALLQSFGVRLTGTADARVVDRTLSSTTPQVAGPVPTDEMRCQITGSKSDL
jgi:hypothetical protein